jgi:hypothetical protein
VYRLLPYREEGNPAVLRPTVDVRLEFGETGDWTLRALIDTGSPITVFDRGAADAVGVRFDYAGAQTGMIRILGGHWAVQFEDVHLSLAVDTEYAWTARVAFVRSPELQMPFQGLLGTEGFLDKFAVTFNKYYDYFVLERPDDFHDRIGGQLAGDPATAPDPQWERPGD